MRFSVIATVLFGASLLPASSRDRSGSAGDDVVQRRVAFPSPFVRLLGIETALKKEGVTVDWAGAYQKIAFRGLKIDELPSEKAVLAFAIGVRTADGVLAMMAKDQARLRSCARDVKACAQKLGIGKDDMPSTNALLRSIEDNDWSQIYFELGMVEQEIVDKLDSKTDRTMTAIVGSGAWLQGIRYACDQIMSQTKKIDLSNMLRAAPIADLLSRELNAAPSDVLTLPLVRKSIEALDQIRPIIDVKRDESIPMERMQRVLELAASTVAGTLK